MNTRILAYFALLSLIFFHTATAEIDRRISIREPLRADRTYYVRTDGDDNNGGYSDSAGGALRTIQKAVDIISEDIDLGKYNVIIQVSDGTYASGVELKPYLRSTGKAIIRGNILTPSNVIIDATSSIPTEGCCFFSRSGPQSWTIEGLALQTTATGFAPYTVACIKADNSEINYSNVIFGASTDYQVFAINNAKIVATGSYAVYGSAKRHLYSIHSVILFTPGTTLALIGNPAFNWQFACAETCGEIDITNVAFSGSATGSRYLVCLNGVIKAQGTLPGSAAGTTSTGGQYQ